MRAPPPALLAKLQTAVASKELLPESLRNIEILLRGAPSDLYERAVTELTDGGQWTELNDRFYKTLAFGTGGLRGRTIGKVVAPSERGDTKDSSALPPQFPCVGTNAMNFFNISRATQGLV